MSNPVRPHRRQPTRLHRPWDSPGKNTGVGCHFLLQCMKVKSESEVAQSCPTLSDPMDCSLLGSSIHGIFQARVLEWGAIAFFVSTSSHFPVINSWVRQRQGHRACTQFQIYKFWEDTVFQSPSNMYSDLKLVCNYATDKLEKLASRIHCRICLQNKPIYNGVWIAF